MEYHITVNEQAEGLLRYDSPEAARYIRPVVYPTASCVLSTLTELTVDMDTPVVITGDELGGRCGVGEDKIAKALARLAEAQHGIVELESIDDHTTAVSINQWLNPPRASARAQRYPPVLLDEFTEFLADAETIVDPEPSVASTESVADFDSDSMSL